MLLAIYSQTQTTQNIHWVILPQSTTYYNDVFEFLKILKKKSTTQKCVFYGIQTNRAFNAKMHVKQFVKHVWYILYSAHIVKTHNFTID